MPSGIVTKPSTANVSQVGELLDEAWEEQLRIKAQSKMSDSIDTLDQLRRKSKSDVVKRQCANDLIEHGHKRKDPNPLAGMLGDGKLAIQVNLIQFEGSEHGREVMALKGKEEAIDVTHEVTTPCDAIDAIDAKPAKVMDPLLELVIRNPADEG